MTVAEQKETLGFQAEVKQLLHLVTHSLYSNKEIFLRELISNASDAADKLRFEALSDEALYEGDSDLKIWVDFDKKTRTVTVRDNGIGMSRDEVIDNLGTIAKSGTKAFLESLGKDKSKDAHMIGQFGVGFYSAYVVADKVIVNTRRAGKQLEQGVSWESDGQGEYSIKNIEKKDRGTEVILYLKKDEDEFLNGWRLRNVITKYSDHILLPIVMKNEDDSKEKDKDKEETVNRATALWTLSKTEIKDEDYKELYKHISHDFQDPLLWIHNRVEGKLEYISLLYIPLSAPFDLFHRDQRRGLKLYVKRVFIMDDAEHLLPMYLRFVKGIVDSNDLPLNVSREILQSSKTIENIQSGVVKRILSELEKLSENDKGKYAQFWKAFGQVLKEGIAEDFSNKDRIAKLLRFASTHESSEEQNVSLADYISRLKQGQDKIYYVTADNFTAAKNSPHLEIFRKKGVEVLLLSEPIDEWLVVHLTEYEGKQLQSVAKGDVDVEKFGDMGLEKKNNEESQKEFAEVIKRANDVLKDKVKEVRLSYRLTDSPACLVLDENDMSAHMQRILQAAGQAAPKSKPIFELNPNHLIVRKLKTEQDKVRFEEWTTILFDQALLAEGGQLEDPATFVKRLNKLLLQLVI